MRAAHHREPWTAEGGGYALALVIIALAGVAVELATGPLYFWLLPRQWLGIHDVLFGLWLIVRAISTRIRPVPATVTLVTLVVSLSPVIGWLAFTRI